MPRIVSHHPPTNQRPSERTGLNVRRIVAVGAVATGALIAAAPVIAVLASLAGPYGETIRHVMTTLGADYVGVTVALCLSVGAVSAVAGVLSALLVALCEFPFRRLLSFALALPLAAPAYIAAYAYADLLGPFGSFAPLSRAMDAAGLPSIRSFAGAVFVLAMTLYPYVYLTTRASFASRPAAMIETARTLGVAPLRAAARLFVPAARPAIAAGVALVMMETAAEFGVADYFGVPTLSVGIFRTWHSFGDLAAASQLASALFLLAALLVVFEAAGRKGRMGEAARVQSRDLRIPLKGANAALAAAFCFVWPLLGFAVPTLAIATKLGGADLAFASRGLVAALGDSIAVAGAGAALAVAAAVALAYANRVSKSGLVKAAVRVVTLGYAIPGAVVAIGILSVFAVAGLPAGGFLALIYAYVVRFLTAGYNTASAGLSQIDAAFDDAARTLGAAHLRILAAIHAPLMRRSIIAAAIIVFVDIVKELPATLILRDFNFETLATRVYRLAGDERLSEAAPNALILIALGALPIILLNAISERSLYRSPRTAASTQSQI